MNQKRKNLVKYRNWQERFGQNSREEKIRDKSNPPYTFRRYT